ncbi:MAG: DUF3786 domain-containing protein [Alphaproteobacteria bacterium]|uniref:DUF3786 domain-containing protein n=1 Tax=Candidatus Nitrobium versatile TaxID=2884831 RepID=A0A953SD90_9BACT|nr:DUF3786 domain-containing protein [Candidatus Nitrobium versatile]
MVPIKIAHGEAKAWEILAALPPEEVCRNAKVSCDNTTQKYFITSFGMDFCVSPVEKTISSNDPQSDLLLDKLKDFFRLGILWYLVNAKDIPFTGRLINPMDVKGGQRFSAGTYLLPTRELAEMFGRDKEGFIKKGKGFGGELQKYGDVSLRLFPLPRVPVTLILWLEDEEFPSRADILLDSTCDFQIASSDIIWAVTLMGAMVMLIEG